MIFLTWRNCVVYIGRLSGTLKPLVHEGLSTWAKFTWPGPKSRVQEIRVRVWRLDLEFSKVNLLGPWLDLPSTTYFEIRHFLNGNRQDLDVI